FGFKVGRRGQHDVLGPRPPHDLNAQRQTFRGSSGAHHSSGPAGYVVHRGIVPARRAGWSVQQWSRDGGRRAENEIKVFEELEHLAATVVELLEQLSELR